MNRYQCLHCLKPLKDKELVCVASCEHYIHEWCIEISNSHAHLLSNCKICDKKVLIHLVFKEYDLVRMLQMDSYPMMLDKLDEISELL